MNARIRIAPSACIALTVLLAAGCGGGGGSSETGAPVAGDSPARAEAPAPQPSGAPAEGGSAVLRGTITFDGTPPNLEPLKMDADPGCAKKHSGPVQPEVLVLGAGNTLGNILVRVTRGLPEGTWPAPTEPAVLDQNGCRYTPHVLGVQVGQTFRVLNSDGLLHNVHALPKVNRTFNRAMPATVRQTDYSFDKVESAFKIKCDVHPWMGAWVSVLAHPFFDVTGTDGTFEINGLPAGTYEIEAWHEKLDPRTATVTVADGGEESVDLTFSM